MSATSFPIGSVEGQIAELNDHIGNVDSKVSSLITIAEWTITAGTTGAVEKTLNVAKTGYTPIGVIGWQAISSFTGVKFDYCYIDGSNLKYRFTNAASAATGCRFTILYVKS